MNYNNNYKLSFINLYEINTCSYNKILGILLLEVTDFNIS